MQVFFFPLLQERQLHHFPASRLSHMEQGQVEGGTGAVLEQKSGNRESWKYFEAQNYKVHCFGKGRIKKNYENSQQIHHSLLISLNVRNQNIHQKTILQHSRAIQQNIRTIHQKRHWQKSLANLSRLSPPQPSVVVFHLFPSFVSTCPCFCPIYLRASRPN